jgi:hypothetical protein
MGGYPGLRVLGCANGSSLINNCLSYDAQPTVSLGQCCCSVLDVGGHSFSF